MKRAENIKSLAFFSDKPILAEQIIALEKKDGDYLPNQFAIKQIPHFEIGERKVSIGKVHQFYYIGIKSSDADWRYQAFESESKCKEFFIQLPDMERKDLAFWLNNVETLAMS